MLNLNGKELEKFTDALRMLARSEHGRYFLAALERDMKTLDAKNRVVGHENEMGAAYYLGRLFEHAGNAGYEATYHYVATGSPAYNRMPKWLHVVLSALYGTERQVAAPVARGSTE